MLSGVVSGAVVSGAVVSGAVVSGAASVGGVSSEASVGCACVSGEGPRPCARARGTAATAAPTGAPPALDEAEPFAILAAAATALAGGAEALAVRAAPPARAVGLGDPLAAERPLVALRHDLALVDPDLHADPAVGRLRLGEAVVDVGADRVERDATLGVPLAAAHLAAAEAAAALDLDPLGARAHRRGERALHRAPERHAVLELLRDRLGDELRVQLGPLDLVDVDVDALAGDRVELLAERVHLDARLADHDAGARRVDVDRDPLLVLADQDVGQAGVRELAVDVVADPDVLEDVVGDLLLARSTSSTSSRG